MTGEQRYQSLGKHLRLEDFNTNIVLALIQGVPLTYEQTVGAMEDYFRGSGITDPERVITERRERADEINQQGHGFVMRHHSGLCDLYDDTRDGPGFDLLNDVYLDDAVRLLREVGVEI